MRSTFLQSTFLAIVLAIIYFSTSSSSGGVTGLSTTGCSCHGASNSATSMTLSGLPAGGWVAGNTYSLTLTILNSTKAAAGFDLTCTQGTFSNAPAGTLASTTASGGELRHTTPALMSGGSVSFNFDWTAPSASASTLVIFHVAGNAVNNTGNQSGDHWSTTNFTSIAAPSGTPPSISLTGISAITSNSATIAGSGNANGASTNVSVDYGLTASFGSNTVSTPSVISGSSATSVSTTLSGLSPSTTYFVRYKATSTAGTTYSLDTIFTTAPPPSNLPILNLNSISGIGTTGATFGGNVNANNALTNLSIEYGLSTAFGSSGSTTPATASGNLSTSLSGTLSGLSPNTLYYVRFKGINTAGTAFSNDTSFTTLPLAPVINPLAVSAITINSATTNANVNANGALTNISVEFGLTTSYGSTQNTSPASSSSNSFQAVSATLGSLTPNTTYHYRFKAVSAGGTIYSPDATFITKPSSVNDFAQSGIVLFPNPSRDYLTLKGLPAHQSMKLTVQSVSGQQAAIRYQLKGADQCELDVRLLSPGYYILTLEMDGRVMNTTFQK
jgi:hypothetical protein